MKTHTLRLLESTLLILFLCNSLLATTVTVSTLSFTGSGSLNDAITTINASPGPHIINFSVTGTITATTLLPIITEDVTINAYDIEIDGAFSYQIFDIASTSTTVINGITIRNALAVVGSVVSNRGNLTLHEVFFSGNRASDRGGAIYNQGGTIDIDNSTINNNNGGTTGGGGIYNTSTGNMTIVNSTITGNFTFGTGGGIENAGIMSLTHITITSNSAFAASNAGGGIHNTGSLAMNNNIVHSNTFGFLGTAQDIYSSSFITTPNPNLVGVCVGACPPFPYTTNPLLSPIADNGGATPTMALLTSSPAIDVGSGAESLDQRIFTRDGAPDLGAYEYGAAVASSGSTIILALKAFLGGAYETSTGLMRSDLQNILPLSDPYGLGFTTTSVVLTNSGANSIVDWVLLEIRDSTNPSSVVVQRAALIQRDGDVVDVDGVSNIAMSTLPSGTFLIALRHRNHLGVMANSILTVP